MTTFRTWAYRYSWSSREIFQIYARSKKLGRKSFLKLESGRKSQIKQKCAALLKKSIVDQLKWKNVGKGAKSLKSVKMSRKFRITETDFTKSGKFQDFGKSEKTGTMQNTQGIAGKSDFSPGETILKPRKIFKFWNKLNVRESLFKNHSKLFIQISRTQCGTKIVKIQNQIPSFCENGDRKCRRIQLYRFGPFWNF